ncbi:MAG TPA: DNA polymerase III subunit delta [Patescibacteria group bacterium]|nr:DNA polymerase III subunit delta [Patescibacteria group bacterium]
MGDNFFLLKAELKKIVEDFKVKNNDLAVINFDQDSDLDLIYQAVKTVDLLSENKLIILSELSLNKEFNQKIEEFLVDVPENITLILVEPNLDKRSVYYKTLSKNTEFKNFFTLTSDKTSYWINEYVKENGGSILPVDANYLSERAGLNQLKLKQEIDKLLLYSSNITKESINLLVEDDYKNSIFQLIDAAFSGKVNQALEILTNLRKQKIEPAQIIATLVWQINILAIVKFAQNKSIQQIATESNQKPFVINKSSYLASRINIPELKDIISKLLGIDIASKSLKFDSEEALKNFILELAYI